MEYTHLGRSGLSVSRLCLGTMNFGSLTPAAEAHAIMDHAHELGMNFFDTANTYGRAQSPPGQVAKNDQSHAGWTEEIIGDWFAQRRRPPRAHGPGDQALRRHGHVAERRQAVRAEHPPRLRRVAAPAADRLHRPVPDAPRRPRHPVGRDLAGDGGARRPGQDPVRRLVQLRGLGHRAGERDRPGPRLLRPGQRAVAVQPDRPATIELEVLPAARAYGVGVIPWSPLERRPARRRAEVRAGGTAAAGRPGEAEVEANREKIAGVRGPVRQARRGARQRGAGLAAAPTG